MSSFVRAVAAPVIGFAALSGNAAAQVTQQQARQIEGAIPTQARVAPKKSRRVLIWNTPFMDKSPHKGYSIPQAEYAMRLLGEKTGAFESVVGDDVALLAPKELGRFDAMILNNSNGPWIRPTETDMAKFPQFGKDIDAAERMLRKSLLDWVLNGGGIVAYHHAVGGNTHWPEFAQLLGAAYWGHPWNESVQIRLDEPDHPLLAAFGGKDFRLAEEIFQFREPYSRDKLRVLLSLDTNRTNMTVPWIHREDNDFALAWIKEHGGGRVFYSAIGHRTEHWWNPTILRFYLDGIQYAMGDIEADARPSGYVGPDFEPRFVSLFNGHDLRGWSGNPRIWTVQDGAITGQTSEQNRIAENDFLIWTGGDVEDFELRLKFRIEGGNSGIYFRTWPRDAMQPEALVGMQADFSADGRWTGVLMEFTQREILAERGQRIEIDPLGKKKVVGSTGDPTELLTRVKAEQWNDYTILAEGGRIVLKINDAVMCEVQDNDPGRIRKGKLALQVHRGPDMKVQFKDIRMREL